MSILTTDSFPDIQEVFSEVQHEENQRKLMLGSPLRLNQSESSTLAAHCSTTSKENQQQSRNGRPGVNTIGDIDIIKKYGRPGINTIGDIDFIKKYAGSYMESLLIGNQQVEIKAINLYLEVMVLCSLEKNNLHLTPYYPVENNRSCYHGTTR
ncbi:hypothetical protein PanWU01x14_024370 [Parasponia andersonii]|uniref:Uncharacterized protein n=1 Tax=Parasponia andersonii TaxID=3476 RepID=A0A2P5DWM6_PARAD|nr:hypothetical protein PanWU01x14_024370 [Parasponia andersonii]